MRFQFQSDIHLEVGNQYNTYKIEPAAPFLILAGDIGNLNQYDLYLNFLRAQCAQFQRVFLVLGNHEFYNITRQAGVDLAEKLTKEDGCAGKLILLNRTCVEVDLASGDVHYRSVDNVNNDATGHNIDENCLTILGCTLNSRIRGSDEEKLLVQMKVSDFHKIHNWTVDDHNAEHEKDVNWLKGELQKTIDITKVSYGHDTEDGADGSRTHPSSISKRNKILVVTHHAPFRKGSAKPEHESAQWQDAFSTELLEPTTSDQQSLAFESKQHFEHESSNSTDGNIFHNVHTWIFGHTHYGTDCIRGGVRCIANQRGYVFPWEMETEKNLEEGQLDLNKTNSPDRGLGNQSLQTQTNNTSNIDFFQRLITSIPRISSKQRKKKKEKQTSFVVRPPQRSVGHQGDGAVSFDPSTTIEF